MRIIPIACYKCREERNVEVDPELCRFTADEHGDEWLTCPFGHQIITKDAYMEVAGGFDEAESDGW